MAERTIREHLQRRGLQRAALAGQPRAFGRFEASRPNELWIGDVLVGPFVPYPRTNGSKRSYLFVVVVAHLLAEQSQPMEGRELSTSARSSRAASPLRVPVAL